MFGEFKDAKNAENANEDERSASSRGLAVSLGLLDDENYEVRNDRQQVEDVHEVLDEVQLGRTRHDAKKKLDSKPRDADRLDHEERVGVVGPLVVGQAAVG